MGIFEFLLGRRNRAEGSTPQKRLILFSGAQETIALRIAARGHRRSLEQKEKKRGNYDRKGKVPGRDTREEVDTCLLGNMSTCEQ